MKSVTVIGAGLGGSLMAVLLGRRGHPVHVYERRPDPRKGSAGRGRSINLAISTRGLAGLERAGLMRELLDVAIPMRGRMVHGPEGTLAFQPYGHEAHHVIHSVSRAGLNRLLVEAAEAMPHVTVDFGKRCVDVDLAAGRCTFDDASTAEADLVVGADGAYSEVRLALQKSDRFDYRQDYLGFVFRPDTLVKNSQRVLSTVTTVSYIQKWGACDAIAHRCNDPNG